MCNISGYNGPKYPDLLKLKLLLSMGSERGEDSIGVSMANKLHKEVKTTTYNNYYNVVNQAQGIHFIQNFDYPTEEECSGEFNVMQHNRKKSSGIVSKDAAHPYEIVYEKEGNLYSFFLMHNGTLTNTDLLAEKYGVKEADYQTDSHLLAYLIFNHGLDVLSFYDGNAALAFYWTENPNQMFLYKGSKQNYKYDNQTKKNIVTEEDERPLHYIYLDGGIYFSSLSSQLSAICNSKEEKEQSLYQVIGKTVMKFDSGKLVEKITIKRTPLQEEKKKTFKLVERVPSSFRHLGTNREHISWHLGEYKIIKKKKAKSTAHGVYKLSGDGTILTSADKDVGKVYYFLDGLMIKDLETYNELLSRFPNGGYKIWTTHCNSAGCNLNEYGKYFYGTIMLWSKVYRPLFSNYYIETTGDSTFKESFTVESAIKLNKLNRTQLEVECFNKMYSTRFNDIFLCKKYYSELMNGQEINWKEQVEDNIDDVLSIPKKEDKASNLFNEVTLYLPDKVDNKKYKDDELDVFNDIYKKKFTTRKEANNWHIEEYNCKYDDSWPADELEIYTDVYDDLPFTDNKKKQTYDDDKDASYKYKLNEEFKEDYKELKENLSNFYSDFFIYNTDLDHHNQKLIEKLGKLIKILN